MFKASLLFIVALIPFLYCSVPLKKVEPLFPEPVYCPKITPMMKKELTLKNDTLTRVLSELQAEAEFNIVTFFNTFFMVPFEDAYKQDVANLIAFQAIMAEEDPAPPSPLSLIFKIFLKMVEKLPEIGPEVSFALDLINDGISLSTNTDEKNSIGKISWEDFIATKALSYPDANQGLTNGLWSYVNAYWKKHDLPSTIKSNTTQRNLLKGLIEHAFKEQETQTEAFLHLVGDYILGIKGYISATMFEKKYEWTLYPITSKTGVTKKLIELTSNCIGATTNFVGSEFQEIPLHFTCPDTIICSPSNSGFGIQGDSVPYSHVCHIISATCMRPMM